MKSSKEKINKIAEALIAAYRRQEELPLPPDWRQRVMKEIRSIDRPALAPNGKSIETKRPSRILSFAAGVGLAVLVMWFILPNLDWYDPSINLKPAIKVLALRSELLLAAEDMDSGLRDLRVTIVQDNKTIEVLYRNFEPPEGFLGYKGSRIKKAEIPLALDAQALNLREGHAVLVVTVRDHSWRNWFQGRLTTFKLEFKVDFYPSPPRGRPPANTGGGGTL